MVELPPPAAHSKRNCTGAVTVRNALPSISAIDDPEPLTPCPPILAELGIAIPVPSYTSLKNVAKCPALLTEAEYSISQVPSLGIVNTDPGTIENVASDLVEPCVTPACSPCSACCTFRDFHVTPVVPTTNAVPAGISSLAWYWLVPTTTTSSFK